MLGTALSGSAVAEEKPAATSARPKPDSENEAVDEANPEAEKAPDTASKDADEPADDEASTGADESEATEEPSAEGKKKEKSLAELEKIAREPPRPEDQVPLVVSFSARPDGARYFIGPADANYDAYGSGFWQQSLEAAEFQPLCEPPCKRAFYPGRYSLAIAEDEDSRPVRAERVLDVREPTAVDGLYQSYQWVRTVGWITMGASVVGGSILVISAANGCGIEDGTCIHDDARVWLGMGVIVAGVTGGLFLTLKDDEAQFSLGPLNASTSSATGASSPGATDTARR